MARFCVMCEGAIITGYIVHNNFKKNIRHLPVILVLVICATIKITWSCFIVHHAEVF